MDPGPLDPSLGSGLCARFDHRGTSDLPWKILPALGAIYVEIFRNIPLLVQLFIWYSSSPKSFQGWELGLSKVSAPFPATDYQCVVPRILYGSPGGGTGAFGHQCAWKRTARRRFGAGAESAASLSAHPLAGRLPDHRADFNFRVLKHHQELGGGIDDRIDRIIEAEPAIRGVHGPLV